MLPCSSKEYTADILMLQCHSLSISRAFREMMIAHALAEVPNECCGLLLGKDAVVERVVAMKSDPPAPDRYYMEPVQQVEVFTEMHKLGQSLLGIYHSHPAGPAEPTGADVQLAYHRGVAYLIISLADADNPEVRAFMLQDGGFEEMRCVVT
jgi:proteasome lid subunit RPN8/RPN11